MVNNPASLNQLVTKLWEDVVSCPTPATAGALWKEHQTIRQMLSEIDKTSGNEVSPKIFPHRSDRLQHMDAFLEWATKMGIETNRVKIGKIELPGVDETCLGLKAVGDIADGDWVVKVPRRAMLGWDDAKRSPALRKLFESDPIIRGMENVALAMFLVCELTKKSDSQWWPYLQTLPESFSTPLFYSESEMNSLRPSPVFEEALKMYRAIVRQFAYFHLIIQRNEQARIARKTKAREAMAEPLLENSSLTVANFSFDVYKWAVACVSTRINFVPSSLALNPDTKPLQVPCLIPFLDMANHSYNGGGSCQKSVYYCVETERAAFLTSRDYRNGQEVLMFYGLRSNGDHLLHNGFIPAQDNPNNVFRLKLGLAKTDKLLEERVKLLESFKLHTNETFDLTQDLMPPHLIKFVRTFTAQDLSNIDSKENTTKSAKFLKDRLELILRGYDDRNIGQLLSKEASFHEKSIGLLLASEKRILVANLARIQTDILS